MVYVADNDMDYIFAIVFSAIVFFVLKERFETDHLRGMGRRGRFESFAIPLAVAALAFYCMA
jgi:hypothetical protein